jgi:hypothetical protein
LANLRLSTHQFRSVPSPTNSDSRYGMFFTPASSLPRELWDWRSVNPREVNNRSAVYRAISQTLRDEPARFHERNRGITIVAKDLSYDEKRKEVVVTITDAKLHGVVDGAHTLDAVIKNQDELSDEGRGKAYVFVKVVVGVDDTQIAEIAGGLNTSQQVDLTSLENLRKHFADLKKALSDESYADQIAYKMNEEKPVDVREVLYYLAVFDKSEYDENRHPVALFGRKEGIVRRFADQANDRVASVSFDILISKAPDILRLRDQLEKAALSFNVGRYKVGKKLRVRSETNRSNELIFLGETVDGKIPLGWIMPMLAGFRANVKWDKPKGSFSWIVPLEELMPLCIARLVNGIQEVHEQENSRPEYVGRNAISWRISYSAVSQAILQWELDRARRK